MQYLQGCAGNAGAKPVTARACGTTISGTGPASFTPCAIVLSFMIIRTFVYSLIGYTSYGSREERPYEIISHSRGQFSKIFNHVR